MFGLGRARFSSLDVKDDSIRVLLFVVKKTREMKGVLLKVLLDYKIA